MMKKVLFHISFLIVFFAASNILNAQNIWLQKAGFYGNREGSCGFSIGDNGYFTTGIDVTVDSAFNDIWSWNQTTNKWTQQAILPAGTRMGASATSVGNFGYVLGGEHPSSCFRTLGGVCAGTFYSDFWRYSADSNTWTELPDFPGGGRNYAVMVGDPQDSAIYYGTGNNNTALFFADWWVYKISTARWTQLDSFPGGQRCYSIGFFANGSIYVGTGDNNDNKLDATNDMWQYNTTTGIWKKIANVPGIYRRQATTFVINNTAYVGMGESSSTTVANDMWQYNAVQDTWTTAAAYPQGAGYAQNGFSIGNNGYVGIGTLGVSDTSTFWEYTPNDSTTGISVINNDRNINLFPNPSHGVVYLSYSGLNGNAQLKVIDILGNTVDSRAIGNKQGKITLNENNLSNGIYFYQVLAQGEPSFTGKFIITR